MLAAVTLVLAVCRYEVVLDPECPTTLLGTLPKAVVMVMLPWFATVKSIGSDQTSCPAAIVTEATPEKARALSVEVSMVLSTAGDARQSAMCADTIVTGPLPPRLENCTRIWLPPSDTCATWRSTLFDSEAGGW